MAYGPTSIGGYMALSPATKEDIGGVKIGAGVNVTDDGTISIPKASTTVPGVVKIGSNIDVKADGEISIRNYAGSSSSGGTANSVNNFKFKAQTSDPGAESALETGTVLFVYS